MKKTLTKEQYAIAEGNGIRKALVNMRLDRLNWSEERAITEPVNEMGSKSFTVAEIMLMKKNNVPEHLAYQRIHNYTPKWDREKAMTTPVKKRGRR